MKSIRRDSAVESYPYPKLMITEDKRIVVLFDNHGEGTVLHSSNPEDGWNIGEYNDVWDMSKFVNFNGEILLSNESD